MDILIVDDMEIFRKQIKRLNLWKEDKRFNLKYEAEDGKEALDILENNSIDLVIADIKMPVINGLELLKEIKDRKIPTKTILLSEHSDFDFARNAIQYGAFDYILKPIKEKELKDILNKVYKHLLKEKEEKNRIENLEKELLNKSNYYYPNKEIMNISNKIILGDENLLKDLDSLFNNLIISFKEEYKVETLLENIYMDIINQIAKESSWIDLYLNLDKIQYLNFNKEDSLNLKFEIFKKRILKIKNKFRALYINVEKNLIQDIIDYILGNIDTIIDISTIADRFYLSKNHISYIFKEETNVTLGNFITMIKMERGKKLIKDGNMKNYEISQVLNYKNPEYFEKIFKKHTKHTPSEYRNI